MNKDIEAVGTDFDKAKMLEMRDKTRSVIYEIAANVYPGMLQEDAVSMAKDALEKNEMVQGWHETLVRFGPNTLKTLGASSIPGVTLKSDDIFFIDIGPVLDESEGDGGDTFTVGENAEMQRCAQDVRRLFHIVRREWLTTRISGKSLYQFATREAEKLGWELNLDWSGHRISDFPHEVIYNGTMADIDFRPAPLLWVLEIHIRHPSAGFGAFYEDLLLDDSYF